jgi:hypothetical protein
VRAKSPNPETTERPSHAFVAQCLSKPEGRRRAVVEEDAPAHLLWPGAQTCWRSRRARDSIRAHRIRPGSAVATMFRRADGRSMASPEGGTSAKETRCNARQDKSRGLIRLKSANRCTIGRPRSHSRARPVSSVGAARGPRSRPRIARRRMAPSASLVCFGLRTAHTIGPWPTLSAQAPGRCRERVSPNRFTLRRTAAPCRSPAPHRGSYRRRAPLANRRLGARFGHSRPPNPQPGMPIGSTTRTDMSSDLASSVPQISLASRRRLRYRARQRGAGPRRGRPMTLGLPVLWRRYLSELRIDRAVADRTSRAYETGWNSFVATSRSMGWRNFQT